MSKANAQELIDQANLLYLEHDDDPKLHRKVIHLFRRAAALDPHNYTPHAALGALYLEVHKYQLAIPHLETAIKLGPSTPTPRLELSEAYKKNRPAPRRFRSGDSRLQGSPNTKR
jgi:cytochrome c-type biogenesis protein CcmH/NrfG